MQLDAFQQNPDLFDIINLNDYFSSRNEPNLQRPGLSITASFIQSSDQHEEVILHQDDHEQRYLVQSTTSRDEEVSSAFTPYFAGDKDKNISTQRGFLGNAYKTSTYPSKTLEPVTGEFNDRLKKPYQSEVIRTDTERRPPIPKDNNVYPVTSFIDTEPETIDDYLAELTGPRSRTLQRRTRKVREGSLNREIDISAVVIGEPYVQRLSGVQTDKGRVLAPVLYCFGS